MKTNRRSNIARESAWDAPVQDVADDKDAVHPLVGVTVHTFDEHQDNEDLLGIVAIEHLARHEWDGLSRPDTGHDHMTSSTRITRKQR